MLTKRNVVADLAKSDQVPVVGENGEWKNIQKAEESKDSKWKNNTCRPIQEVQIMQEYIYIYIYTQNFTGPLCVYYLKRLRKSYGTIFDLKTTSA